MKINSGHVKKGLELNSKMGVGGGFHKKTISANSAM